MLTGFVYTEASAFNLRGLVLIKNKSGGFI